MKNPMRQQSLRLRWLLLLLASAGTPALADTFVVTTTADSGPGSLREAMHAANTSAEASTITFASQANGVITLASPLPDLLALGGDLTIVGNGAANTIIDGDHAHRPFSLLWQDHVHVTLRALTVRNGLADQQQGGAIYFYGGAQSRLDIDAVEFVGNHATWEGGALYTSIDTTIRNSLFEANQAGTAGGAVDNNGAAFTISNTAFTGNRGTSIMETDSAGTTRLVNTTFVDNQPLKLASLASLNGSSVSISNSILGNSSDHPAIASDHNGHFDVTTSFNNVIGDAGNSGIADGVNGNRVGVDDVLVGPPGDYGGDIRTLPLLPGSPALDAGTSAGSDIPASDVRGVARVGAPDAGAFESRGFTLTASSGGGQSAIVGTSFAAPLVVQVAANDAGEPVEGGMLTFAAPASGASATLSVAEIDEFGRAQATATANDVVGGPYTVTATSARSTPTTGVSFSLTNLAGSDDCASFVFPYTLSGADNAARVAELRQAIECANENGSDDTIDLNAQTLVFSDAPYTDTDGANALPLVSGPLSLRNGALERDSTQPFRFLKSTDDEIDLSLELMRLSNGSVAGEGGAVLALGSLSLHKCVFSNNHADLAGGALAVHGQSQILRSSFSGNSAADGAATAHWGSILLVDSRVSGNGDADSRSVLWSDYYAAILSSLFVDNHPGAANSSLLVFAQNTEVAEMRHVTIADNSVNGKLVVRDQPPPANAHTYNSIVWNNECAGIGDIASSYSIVPGQGGGVNFDQPPGFVAPGDYHLDSGSPAIDSGSYPYSSPLPPDDGNDGFLAGQLPDLGLDPRPVDDPGVADTGDDGNSGQAIVDMGAYERQTPSAAAGITVTPSSGLVTTEAGGTATFTVVLDRYPAADVSIAVDSSNPAEGFAAPAVLSFTQANWNQPHTVTVTGMDDGVVDGDQSYTIVTAAAVSTDPAYAGMNAADVTVVNTDNDVADLHVGGSVIGLTGSGLVLALDNAGETLAIDADGGFAFAAVLAPGTDYAVSVASQPQNPAQACVVINGSGTLGNADVGDVVVNCGASGTHVIGGTVSGLAGGGLVLQLNGGGDLAVSANGDYAFASRLGSGAGYVATIKTQPQGQLCTLANAIGTVGDTDVDDIDIHCAPLQAALYLTVDDGHDYARYGQVRDYFVTLGNNGNVTGSQPINATFGPAFDVANTHWQCLDAGAGATCTDSGEGDFHDSASVPPNSSVTWVISVPVLADSTDAQAMLTVGATPTGTTGSLAGADIDTLVIFRDGLDVPYGDGTEAVGDDKPLRLDDDRDVAIDWPAQAAPGIHSVRTLDTADGRVEVQRLRWRDSDYVRLLGSDRDGRQRASAWAAVAPAASLVVNRLRDDANSATVLLEGAAHPLALPPAAGAQTGDFQ